MTGSTRSEDDGPRREREAVHPDYARGQDHDEQGTGGADFARGQRQHELSPHEGNFAEGQAHPEQYEEATDHEDFARGQRQGDRHQS